MDALILFGVAAVLLLVLVGLSGALALLERAFPDVTRWLDEYVGMPGPWEQ